MKTAVLTDSSSDLDLTQADTLGAHLLLLTLQFDGKDWLDHLELSSEEMFSRIAQGAALPTLKLPSTEHYHKNIENLLRRYDHVFALHSSPELGQIYDFAVQAAQDFAGRVTIYNSGNTSTGMALQTERAVQLLKKGLGPAEVAQVLQQSQTQQCSRICVSTLDGLHRSKLISGSLARLGAIRKTKPILGICEGKLIPVANERGRAARLERMLSMLREQAQRFEAGRIIYGHNGDPMAVDTLRQEGHKLGLREVMNLQIGAVLSSFCGPDTYSFSLEPEKIWYKFQQY